MDISENGRKIYVDITVKTIHNLMSRVRQAQKNRRDFRHAGFTGNFIYFLMSLRLNAAPFSMLVPIFLYGIPKSVQSLDGLAV